MDREAALNKLEAKILEMIARLSHLEEENVKLRKELEDQKKVHSALKHQLSLTAGELATQIERLKKFRDSVARN